MEPHRTAGRRRCRVSDLIFYEGGLEFRSEDGEPRIRDIDLAERLGYERLRDIRKLIDRFANEIELRAIVAQTSGRPAAEYWLTEEQALFIIAKSETPKATEILKLVIRAFIAVRRQLARDEQSLKSIPRRLIEAFLLPGPRSRMNETDVFRPSLVQAISDVYAIPWAGGVHPRFQAITNKMIYDRVCSSTVANEIKLRNPIPKWGNNHWQYFTPEALEWFRAQLKIVEAIARQAGDRVDFWRRMDREYAEGMLQLALSAP